MKLTHKFVVDASKSYTFPEEIDLYYKDLTTFLPHVVEHRGQLWEWITYNKINNSDDEVEIVYSPMSGTGFGEFVTVGPKNPVTVLCCCGATKAGSPGHANWCDSVNLDPWDVAVKNFIIERERDREELQADFNNWPYFSSF